jgi:hypothetical protein
MCAFHRLTRLNFLYKERKEKKSLRVNGPSGKLKIQLRSLALVVRPDED